MQNAGFAVKRYRLVIMLCHTMLPSSADALAMRCRSQEIASVSGRIPRTQFSTRSSPFQPPIAQRRPLLMTGLRCSTTPAERPLQQQQTLPQALPAEPLPQLHPVQVLQASLPLWLLTTAPALAAEADFSQGSASQGSYYATLFLFVSTVPGMVNVNEPVAFEA